MEIYKENMKLTRKVMSLPILKILDTRFLRASGRKTVSKSFGQPVRQPSLALFGLAKSYPQKKILLAQMIPFSGRILNLLVKTMC